LKKTFIVFFLVLIITAGAFWYFNQYHHKKVDSWQFVPANAILAYENSSIVENWNKILDKSVWKTIKKMPYFGNWEAALINADSLSGKDGSLDRLFRNHRFIVSVHITASKEFDFLFNLDLKDQAGKANFDHVIRSIQKETRLIAKSRTYLGFEIHELVSKDNASTFTYFIYENVIVGSYTPFLVEDVVRNVADRFKESFKSQIAALQSISKLENDEGNIYIDYSKLPDLLASFLDEQKAVELENLTRFSGDTYLDVKVTDNEILLNGVSTVDLSADKSFLGTLRNQSPGRIRITELMPGSTALLYHVSFSNFKEWQTQLTKYWSRTDEEQFRRYMDFEEKYQLNFDWVKGEAASAILETPNRAVPDRLVFIGISDKDLVFNELSSFAEKLGSEQSDSVYMEMYNDLPIVQLPFLEFPSLIMGNFFSGFENSFITIYEDYLVLGNSMQAVKFFLNSMEDESNWGKSVRQNIFLENTLSEASFSMMINTSLCWRMITDHLNDRWREVFRSYEYPLKSFDLLSLQVSNLDKRFYTSVAIEHQEKVETRPRETRLQKEQSIYTISPITTRPFIVKNHNNNRFEVLVQDSAKILYQISNEGEILWGDSLRAAIVTDIFQIDFYKNGKLQYLFASKDKLHLLDRNGDYVENYPVALRDGVKAQHLSVIDYDNSKNYRFMVADVSGNIYLYDKTGKNLEGWTPRALDAPLAVPGFHVRVKGGDCMIAFQTTGILNVMNRRGEMYPGFPIDLNVIGVSDVFVDIGNDFSSTKLITVSAEGEVIEVNLKGKILKREQLYKPAKESRFWLVNDALKKAYVIARQEYNKISFLNSQGETILENDLFSAGKLEVQYYNFNTDNQIFVTLDPEQEFAYLYNQSGKQITFEPIECGHPVALLYSARNREYQLYRCYNKNLTLEIFK
jgi:hypothetical protein